MHGGVRLAAQEVAGSRPLDPDSLERLVPDELSPGDTTGREALEIGLARYAFAAEHARPGRLLDIACGVGYGTRLLADRVPGLALAIGVDLSRAAVDYASRRYGDERTRFVAADAMSFRDPEGFDTVVSIETIEHLPEPRAFAEHVAGLLRPGGVLVASVPTTPSVDGNPHHLHDFSERSFRRLFDGLGLSERAAFRQDQPFSPFAVLTRSEARLSQVRRNLPLWYLRHPDSLVRRVAATLRHGFKNRYLTLVLARG